MIDAGLLIRRISTREPSEAVFRHMTRTFIVLSAAAFALTLGLRSLNADTDAAPAQKPQATQSAACG